MKRSLRRRCRCSGVGACARSGTSACIRGVVQGNCTPGAPAANDITCDGIDDDCNGVADDGFVPTIISCAMTGCQALGHVRCTNGDLLDDCPTAGVCATETECGDGADNDHDGAADCVDNDCAAVLGCAPASDPASSAPALDTSAATLFSDVVSFIASGSDPIQRGLVPGAIVPALTALIEGHARTRDGAALAGAVVSVVSHPELGTTRTRSDGDFEMLVPGGGALTIRFEHGGYLSLDRSSFSILGALDRCLNAEDDTLWNACGDSIVE